MLDDFSIAQELTTRPDCRTHPELYKNAQEAANESPRVSWRLFRLSLGHGGRGLCELQIVVCLSFCRPDIADCQTY